MKKFFISISFVVCILLSFSCEIGLGAAVDTEAPSIDILSPQPDAVIRGAFNFGGTWSDDGNISSLKITLDKTDGTGSYGPFDGIMTESDSEDTANTWSCIVNPTDGNVIDGAYIATVSITDEAEHTTTQSRQFVIDNTAPIIVLQRPSSKSDASASDSDSYGQTFTLEGQAADDNDVSLIRIYFYSDAECTNLVHYVDLKTVPLAISLDVAKFGDDNYTKIYGSATKDGKKTLYCKIVAYDGAQRYPVEGNQSADDTLGNSTSTYYLYEDISSSVLTSNKITEVYHMMNRTYLTSGSNRSAETVNSVLSTLSSNVVSIGTFTLNPENNPTFTVSGKQLEAGSNFENGNYDVTNGAAVVIEVAPGLDGISLNRDSLKLYGIQCDKNGNIVSGAGELPITNFTPKVNGTSQKFVATMTKADGFAIGSNYLFVVHGEDTSGNPVIANGNPYGFHFTSSGAAPKYENIVPSGAYLYKKVGDSISLSGDFITDAGTPEVTIKLGSDSYQVPNVKKTDSDSERYHFEYTLDADKFSQSESAQYDLKICGKTEAEVEIQKYVMYDVKAPDVTFDEVSPTSKKYTYDSTAGNYVLTDSEEKYLNGTVNVKLSITDSFDIVNLSGDTAPVLEISRADGSASVTYPLVENGSLKRNISIDTTDSRLSGFGDVKMTIKAYDRAGNYNSAEKSYTIDQDCDKPVIVLPEKMNYNMVTKAQFDAAGNLNNLVAANGNVEFTLYDDDGISDFKVYKLEYTNGDTKDTVSKPADCVAGITTTGTFCPSTSAGLFWYWFDVTDKNGNVTSCGPVLIRITAAAPTISRVTSEAYLSNGTKVSSNYTNTSGYFNNTIEISSDQKPFKIYRKVDGKDAAFVYLKDSDSTTVTDKVDLSTLELSLTGDAPTVKVTYKVQDVSGHDSTNNWEVTCTVDNQKPDISITSSTPNVYAASNTFIGTASDTLSGISKVEVSFDGTNWSNATSSGWNYDCNYETAGLTEGINTFYVRAVDNVGNTSNPVTQAFTYDKAYPSIEVKLDGSVLTDETTQVKTAAYTFKYKAADSWGIKDNGVTLSLTKNGTAVTPATSADGEYVKVDLPAGSGDGLYQYTIAATDKAGKSTTVTRSVRLDTNGPSISLSTPNFDDWQNASSVSVFGTASDDTGVSAVFYKFDKAGNGTAPSVLNSVTESDWTGAGWSKATGVNVWSFGISDIQEGETGKLYISAVDTNGTASALITKTIKMDLDVPSLSVTDSTVPAYMASSGFTISGTAKDTYKLADTNALKVTQVFTPSSGSAATCTTYITGVNGKANTETLWSINVPFDASGIKTTASTDGTYKYTFELKDAAGKTTTSKTYTTTVDTTGPAVTITSPASGKTGKNAISEASPLFKGTVSDTTNVISGVYYKIQKGGTSPAAVTSGENALSAAKWTAAGFSSVSSYSTTEWSFNPKFVNGTSTPASDEYKESTGYTVYMYAVDGAGNVSSTAVTQTFDVDLNYPELTAGITTGTNCKEQNSIYYFNGTNLTGTITASDTAGSVTNTYKIDNGTAESLSVTSGTWSISADKITAGKSKKITIITTDLVGKTTSADFYVYKDVTAPTLGTTAPNTYYDGDVTLSGTVTDTGAGPAKVQYSTTSGGTYSDVTYSAGDTSWTLSLTTAQLGDEGTKTYYFKAQDNLGNTTAEKSVSFKFDKNAPVLTQTDSYKTGETNYVKSGFTLTGTIYDTNLVDRVVIAKNDEATPGYSSKVSPATVTLGDVTNAKSAGTAAAWSKTFAKGDLADGTYKLKVTGYDIAERASASYTKTFVVDTAAPTVVLKALPNKESTKGTSYTFRGTGTDATSGIKEVYLTISGKDAGGNTVTKTVKVDGDSSWSYELNFTDTTTTDDTDGTANSWSQIFGAEGDKTLSVKAADYAGNESAKFTYNNADNSSVTFVYDKANPVLTVDSSTITEYMPQAGFTIKGTAVDSYKLHSLKVTQNDGVNTYTKYITKAADGVTNLDGAENTTISWEINVPFNSAGTKVDAADGTTYTYKFDLEDSVGNHYSDNPKEYSSVADLTAPVLAVTKPSGAAGTNSISENNYKIYGTFTEDHISNIYYKVLSSTASTPSAPSTGVTAASNWTSAAGGSWSVVSTIGTASWNFYQQFKAKGASGDGLAEGSYKLYLYAVDGAGNISTLSTTAFDVDMAAPVITTKLDDTALSTTENQTKTENTYLLSFLITETNGLDSTSPCTVTVKKDSNTTLTRGTDYKIYTGTSGNLTVFTGDAFAAGTTYTIKLEAAATDALYSYSIGAKDICGKTETVTRNVRLDTTGPVLGITSPAFTGNISAWQTSSSITINGTASDVSGVNAVYYVFDSATVPEVPSTGTLTESTWTGMTVPWTKLTGTSNWKIELSGVSDQADHKLYLTAVDANGIVCSKLTETLRKDGTLPSFEETEVGSTGKSVTAADSNLTLSGTFSDAVSGVESITITDSLNLNSKWEFTSTDLASDIDGTATGATRGWTKSTGAWSQKISLDNADNKLKDGVHVITITAKDKAGNSSIIQRNIKVDTQAPSTAGTIKIMKNDFSGERTADYTSGEKSWYKTSAIPVQIENVIDSDHSSAHGYTSGIASVEYSTNATGITDTSATWIPMSVKADKTTWTATASCTDQGKNTIYIRVKDGVGNTAASVARIVYIDTVAPSIPTDYWVDGEYQKSTTKLINKRSAVVINAVSADSGDADKVSGIAGFKTGSSSVVTSTSKYTPEGGTETDVYSLSIATSDLPSRDSAASITITDKVGNTTTWQPFAFSVDTDAPSVKIKTPSNAGTNAAGKVLVNKTIDFNGTASDTKGLQMVDICYYINADTPSGATPAYTGKTWTHLARITSNPAVWSTSINTATAFGTIPDGTEVILCVIATDEAGNRNLDSGSGATAVDNTTAVTNASGTETGRIPGSSVTIADANKYSIVVDQDTDRPVIKFTTLNLGTGMTGSSRIGYENTEINGNVTDDDGIPSSLEYKIGADGTYGTTGLSYSSSDGIFTLSVTDGSQDIFFRVKDDEASTAANPVYFESNTTSAYNANSVKLTDTAGNKYGYTQTGTPVAALYNSVIYTTIDTQAPEVVTAEYTRDKSDSTSWSTAISSQVFGGTKNTFYLRQYAYDINTVKNVYLSIPKNDSDGTSSAVTAWSYTNATTKVKTTYYTNGSSPLAGADYWSTFDITTTKAGTISSVGTGTITIGTTEYTKEAYIFPLKNDSTTKWATDNRYTLWESENAIDVTGLATGNRIASLIATDGIKSTTSSVNLTIDFTAPVVTFNGPSTTTTSSGSVTAYGSVDSSATLYYAISPSGTVSPGSTTAVTSWQDDSGTSHTIPDIHSKDKYGYKAISDASISWFVYFDNDNSATGTHEDVLNNYLVNYGITTSAALAATDSTQFDTLVKLYIWIKAVDESGNTSESCQGFVLDPQGDRPTVAYSYPSSDGVTYGGEIRLTGSADDTKGTTNAKIGVETVWAQIISTTHTYNSYVTTGKTFGTITTDSTTHAVTGFTITKDDLDYLVAAGYTLYNMKTYHSESTHTPYDGTLATGAAASDYGILCTLNGSSWSLTINSSSKKELDVASGTNNVAIRIRAQDKDGKFSTNTDRFMIFDAQNPVIGNSQALYLVQSASTAIGGTETAPKFAATSSKEYTENMFVRGDWYLIGSVEDNDAIAELTINGSELVKGGELKTDTNWGLQGYSVKTGSTNKDYKKIYFKYKLSTGTGVGDLQFDISVKDEASPTPGSTTKTIKVCYDNTAPVLAGASDSAYNINPTVVQSDGFYTFGSKVSEDSVGGKNQSGLDFIAFYFMRRNRVSTEVDTIYNPMLASSNSTTVSASTSSSLTGSEDDGTIVYSSGLYWIKKTVTRTVALNALTITTDNYIRKNGLVMMDGSLYKITDRTATGITLNGNPPSGVTTAYFALAMLVDNTVQENGGSAKDSTTHYPTTIANDDGDGMVEYVKTTGVWTADIVSRNIPDGPIELHYVAFDQAGNYSIGIMGNDTESDFAGTSNVMTPDRTEYKTQKTATSRTSNVLYVYGNGSSCASVANGTSTVVTNTNLYKAAFIANNAPRIASVTIWTDYDADGTVDSGESFIKYQSEKEVISGGNVVKKAGGVTSKMVVSGNGNSYSDTTKGTAYLTIRDKTTFTPEIVGGNGNLEYKGRVAKASAISSASYSSLSSGFITTTASPQVETSDYMDSTGSYVDSSKTRTGTITFGGADSDSDGVLDDFNTYCDGVNSKDDTDPYWFEYLIYDSTEGTTPGTNSLYATLQLALNVQYFDTTPPKAWIRPFYWTKSGKPSSGNDLYNSISWDASGNALGHIELESDLSSTLTALTTGSSSTALGSDPKVSGQIVVEGYAYDNIQLHELYAKFETHSGIGTNYTLINSYSSGSWVNNLTGTGWSCTAEDVYSNANGHLVHWLLTIDTSKITNVADLDKTVTVFAVDKRGTATNTSIISGTTITGNNSYSDIPASASQTTVPFATWSAVKSSGTAYYTDAACTTQADSTTADTAVVYTKVPYYKMDVVPYISGISTPNRTNSGLKDNNIRSASGKYSVIKGSTANFMTVSGFNLNATAARIVDTSTVTGAVTASSGVELTNGTVASDYTSVGVKNDGTKSGYLELIVNGIRTLNNVNNNNAHGSLTFTGGTAAARTAAVADYANMPNREADYNTTKNVQLTDDRYIRFFDMKDTGVTNGYYPTMIMNGDNPVFGYVDNNGGPSTAAGTGAGTGAGSYQGTNAMPQRAEFDGTSATEIYTEYLGKALAFDQMAMAVDEDGRYIQSSVANYSGDYMSIYYDRYNELHTPNYGYGWCGETKYQYYNGDLASNSSNNAIAIDSVGSYTGRFQYPKLVAKGKTRTGVGNIYMAYYDATTGNIYLRDFMIGTKKTSTQTYTATIPSGTTYTVTLKNSSRLSFTDQASANAMASTTVYLCNSDGVVIGTATTSASTKSSQGYYYVTLSDANYETGYSVSDVSSIALQSSGTTTEQRTKTVADIEGNTSGVVNALYSGGTDNNNLAFEQYVNFNESTSDTSTRHTIVSNASKHYALAVTSDYHVILVYYDETSSRLKLLYSTNAVTGSDPTASVAWTTSSLSFPEYVGNYVSMALDSKDGIHISAFNAGDSDLSYIYIQTYNATSYTHYTVDQYGAVGNWTQIKINSANQPVIAYTNATENGQRDAIKLAYATGALNLSGTTSAIGTVKAGVDSNNYTTGNWEYMTVPAKTPPQGGDSKFQNVCLDFDSAGRPVVGYLGTNLEFGKWLDE